MNAPSQPTAPIEAPTPAPVADASPAAVDPIAALQASMDAAKAAADAPAEETPAVDPDAPPAPAEANPAEETKLARAQRAAEKAKRDAAARRQREAEFQRARTRAADADRLEKERQDLYSRARTDKLGFVRELGLTPEEIARAAIQDGTPEGQIAAVRQQLESERKARVELEQRIAQSQQAQHSERIIGEFHKEAEADGKYPAVARLAKEMRLVMAQHIIDRSLKAGHHPTNAEVLDYLQEQLSGPAPARTTPAPAPGANAKPSQATPRTITNGLSTSKASRPVDLDSLSDHEQRRYLAKQYEADSRK